MDNNLKRLLSLVTLLCLIAVIAHSQTPDTLEVATVQEKSQAITLRMERELSLSKEQTTKVYQVLVERFRDLQASAGNLTRLLETANGDAMQKLAVILSNEQYSRLQQLRQKKKADKEKYLKDHPGFTFTREDLEMDF